jgi:hypothetical protein
MQILWTGERKWHAKPRAAIYQEFSKLLLLNTRGKKLTVCGLHLQCEWTRNACLVGAGLKNRLNRFAHTFRL